METTVSDKAGRFFEGYAYQFDEIYRIQQMRGLRGWVNRRLRASMLIRYRNTFEFLQPIKGRTVVDVGCGSGRYVLTCLDLGTSEVAAIDLSKQMLALLKESLDRANIPPDHVSLIEGDFLCIDLPKQYDYGVVMGVMDYIQEAEKFLSRLNASVRRRAVLSFPVRESIWMAQRKIRYRLRGCPLYFYSRAGVQTLMNASGFSSYTIERIGRDYFVVADT